VSSPTAVAAPASTPTVRVAARRSLFWILAAAFLLVIAIVVMVVRGATGPPGDPLAPTNAAPAGSMAVAKVLEEHGVDVTSATSYARARAAIVSPQSTLVIYDPQNYLSSARLSTLAAESNNVVLVTPSFSQLRALAPAIGQAGAAKNRVLKAGCALPAATQAGTISGRGNGYRIVDTKASSVGCFSSGKGILSLVQVQTGARIVTVLGADQVLANESVASNGNAALALNLLGSEHTLVWYLPSAEDAAAGSLPTIAELTPRWVSSLALLLILTALVAAFWRGRRLGPLVVENLPVTVRASETMEGRARLYQKNSARLHALDALRIGALERLARLCGLPLAASTTEVISGVAAVTGQNRTQVSRALLEAVPVNDQELIRLSDDLLELEAAVTKAVLK
jgi:hypothetical protein